MKFNILILFILLIIVLPTKTYAISPISMPFGGPILASYECSCNGGWFILVFDQKTKMPVPLTFQFGLSGLRANYNIFTPSVQTLGSYSIGGWCSPASTGCNGFPTQGTITPLPISGIGTGGI